MSENNSSVERIGSDVPGKGRTPAGSPTDTPTVDVFLSYKQGADAARAALIRTRLEQLGVSVWQDVEAAKIGDAAWEDVMQFRLQNCRAILVLWTEASAGSEYVRGEARAGLRRRVLVNVCLATFRAADLRVPYDGLLAPHLEPWFAAGGRGDDHEWHSLLGLLGEKLGRPGLPELAVCLHDGSLEAKRHFVRKRPDDPFASEFGNEFADLEQQRYRAEEAEIRKRLKSSLDKFEKAIKRSDQEQQRRLTLIRQGNDPTAGPLTSLNSYLLRFRDLGRLSEEASGELHDRVRQVEETLAESRAEMASLNQTIERLQPFEARAIKAAAEAEQLAQDVKASGDELRRATDDRDASALALAGARVELEQARVTSESRGSRLQELESALASGKPPSRARPAFAVAAALLIGAAIAAGTMVASGYSHQTTAGATKSSAEIAAGEALVRERERAVGDRERTAGVREGEIRAQEAGLRRRDEEIVARTSDLARKDDEQRRTEARLREWQASVQAREDELNGRAAALNTRQAAIERKEGEVRAREDAIRSPALASPTVPTTPAAVPYPAAPAVVAAPPSATAIARCDAAAGSSIDPDRPGPLAWSPSEDDDIPDTAISSCEEAKRAAPDARSRRRVMVILGRAYAAAGKRAELAGDRTTSTRRFNDAVREWEEAARLDSGHAFYMLGSYYRKSFNPVRNSEFPTSVDFEKMLTNFVEAARRDNPLGLVTAAYYLIFPDRYENRRYAARRDDAQARRFLDNRATLIVPQRSFVIGQAELAGRAYRENIRAGLSHIAYAACRGERGAKAYLPDIAARYRQQGMDPNLCTRYSAAD